jgi:putative transposase
MMLLTEGHMSDHKGARLLFSVLPRAKELLADKGYDSDWFRAALIAQGTTPCIPPRKNRKVQYSYDKDLYRQRHKIENVFGKIKDWRRVTTATTVALTPSCPPSPSPQHAATGYDQ